ncbi:MAG TPA: 5-formyltetrahydrofolate cyclo-ligase [Alphaproteobacteria bacterium]
MSDNEKAQLRRDLKEWCAGHVPAMNQQHAAQIAEQIVTTLKSHVAGGVISCYLSLTDEVDSQPLMQALCRAGYRIVLPVVITKERPLVFRLYHDGDKLIKDAAGLPVPHADSIELVPDAVIVPILGFNDKNFRLGRGGGYYDRTLSTLQPILTIGLGYEAQKVDFTPDGHDIPLDYIVTESQIRAANSLF